jgi:hypothetical protein
MKNGVFWDIVFLRSVRRLLVTANVVPSSPILVTLMTCETSVLTTATRRNIPRRSHSLFQTSVHIRNTRRHIPEYRNIRTPMLYVKHVRVTARWRPWSISTTKRNSNKRLISVDLK